MRLRLDRMAFFNESGVGLVESLIAIAIVGIAVTIFIAGLSTGSVAVQQNDIRVTAENLARSQMEYTKAQVYDTVPASYDIITPVPDRYSVLAVASSIAGRDSDIQKITVTINYSSEEVLSLEGYKGNR